MIPGDESVLNFLTAVSQLTKYSRKHLNQEIDSIGNPTRWTRGKDVAPRSQKWSKEGKGEEEEKEEGEEEKEVEEEGEGEEE